MRAAAWSLAAGLLAGSAAAEEADPQAVGITYAHGTSYLEPLKYEPGFTHFDYVDPNAPKGGMVRVADRGTYDSFNGILDRGRVARGFERLGEWALTYDRLLEQSIDELLRAPGVRRVGRR